MRTIALTTRKGGSGKSTLAIGLAVAAMQDGERVFLLETDRQGTVSKWGERRGTGEPGIEPITDESGLNRSLEQLDIKGYTIAIIDTPAADGAATMAAVRVADLCLIPARPSPVDIEATHPTLAIIRRELERPWRSRFALHCATQRSSRCHWGWSRSVGVRAQRKGCERNSRPMGLGQAQAQRRADYNPTGGCACGCPRNQSGSIPEHGTKHSEVGVCPLGFLASTKDRLPMS
jgi:chromosome partitioning protein